MSRGLIILTYHRILEVPDPLRAGCATVDSFAGQMRVLANFFNVLPLSDACRRLKDKSLPPRSVSITFDDGYADNFTLAWPILRELELPWTIFVATGYLDGGRMWNDTVIEAIARMPVTKLDLDDLGLGIHSVEDDAQRAAATNKVVTQLKHVEPHIRAAIATQLSERAESALPEDLMLTREQVAELAHSGVEVGGHTVTHPILKVAGSAEARKEITAGKLELEKITGRPVNLFAYPNGRPNVDYDETHVEAVRDAKFSFAVSTEPGLAKSTSDSLQLPRFGPWDESPLRFGLRLLRMYM